MQDLYVIATVTVWVSECFKFSDPVIDQTTYFTVQLKTNKMFIKMIICIVFLHNRKNVIEKNNKLKQKLFLGAFLVISPSGVCIGN